jgi:hypothetical protein
MVEGAALTLSVGSVASPGACATAVAMQPCRCATSTAFCAPTGAPHPLPGSKPDWRAATFLSRSKGRAPAPPTLLASGGFAGWAKCSAASSDQKHEKRHYTLMPSPTYAEPSVVVEADYSCAAAAYHQRRSVARPAGCSTGGVTASHQQVSGGNGTTGAAASYRRSRREVPHPGASERPQGRRALPEPRHQPPRFSGKCIGSPWHPCRYMSYRHGTQDCLVFIPWAGLAHFIGPISCTPARLANTGVKPAPTQLLSKPPATLPEPNIPRLQRSAAVPGQQQHQVSGMMLVPFAACVTVGCNACTYLRRCLWHSP